MTIRDLITIAVALGASYGGGASLVGTLWAEVQLRSNGAPKHYRALSFSPIAMWENVFFYRQEFKLYGSAHLAMRVARSGLVAFMTAFAVGVVLALSAPR